MTRLATSGGKRNPGPTLHSLAILLFISAGDHHHPHPHDGDVYVYVYVHDVYDDHDDDEENGFT